MPRRFLAVFACLLLGPSLSRADEVSRPPIELGGQLSLQLPDAIHVRGGPGFLAQVQVNPWLRLGGRILSADTSVPFEEGGEETGHHSSWHLEARAEGHLRSSSIIDPWMGLGLGPYRTVFHLPPTHSGAYRSLQQSAPCQGGCWGFEATADLGVDFHLGSVVSLGPFVSARVPFSAQKTPEDKAALYLLLPSLRLTVTF